MKRLRCAHSLLAARLPRPQSAADVPAPVAVDLHRAGRDPGRALAWKLGLAVGLVAIGTSAAVAWRATPPASLVEGSIEAPSSRTIKSPPTRTLAFDGSTGMIAIERRALEGLRQGDYVFAKFGTATLAWRVARRERRADHLFVGLAGFDPVTRRATSAHGSYHLYADTVSHAIDTPEVAFDVYGRLGTDIGFVNTHRSPSRAERRFGPGRAHAAH